MCVCVCNSTCQSWLEDTCSSNGWKHTSSPMVWRELTDRGGKGMLLGGFSDFLEYVQVLSIKIWNKIFRKIPPLQKTSYQ